MRARGSKHPRAKISERDVATIIGLVVAGYSIQRIGRKFHLSSASVSRIWRGLEWSHVRLPPELEADRNALLLRRAREHLDRATENIVALRTRLKSRRRMGGSA